MEDTNIEDYLGGKFKDFEAEPLQGSFNAMIEKLDAAKRKKRRAFYLYMLSGAAALLLVYLAIPFAENTKQSTGITANQLSNRVLLPKKGNDFKTIENATAKQNESL